MAGTEDVRSDGKQSTQKTPEGPLSTENVPTISSENDRPPRTNAKTGSQKMPTRFIEWLQLVAQVLLVFVGAYAVFIYGGQLKVFKAQFSEMQRQTGILNKQAQQSAQDALAASRQVDRQLKIAQEQTRAAQRQAKAAQSGIELVQRQMRQDQRAWLTINFGDIPGIAEGKPLSIPIKITNTGKTAAMEFAAQIAVRRIENTVEAGAKLDFGFEFPHMAETSSLLLSSDPPDVRSVMEVERVGPNGQIVPHNLSGAEVNRLRSGEDFVLVYARLTYKDIFGVAHATNACHFSSPSGRNVYARKCSNYGSMDNN